MAIGRSSPAFRVWVALARSHRRVADAVEAALKAEGLPGLDWYDVLLELERQGGPMRSRDLQQKLLLAQYNLSRLLDRLEGRGMIEREPDPDDGRSRLVRVTEAGIAIRSRMWPVYQGTIESTLGQTFSTAEALQLADLLCAAAAEPRRGRDAATE